MLADGTNVRAERPGDIAAIPEVHTEAFGQAAEAHLVDQLRDDGDAIASLVIESAGGIVGHILFSQLRIVAPDRTVPAAALAPVGVRPPVQRQGLGSMLIHAGLQRCRELGIEAVVVLGHPAYYPRFGFSTALARKLTAPYSGPAFMALELVPNCLASGGAVTYPPAFEA